MNVLILVMSARREPWGELMDTQMATWDKDQYPNTMVGYYCGKSENPFTDARIWHSPTLTESLEDVASRTIEAFETALNFNWDYLARPHSSTYVHKANLVKFCERFHHPANVLCGIMTEGEKPFIWGGCHYVFSRDVIERFVANKDKWNTAVMEDGSITEMAKMLEIPVTPGWSATINMMDNGEYMTLVYGPGENFTFTNFENIGEKLNPHFFVRCKQDLRRHEDARIMRELLKHWR